MKKFFGGLVLGALLLSLALPYVVEGQGSSRLRFPSGTQALPGMAFASSPATGFRLSAANTITAQVDAFEFRSGGSGMVKVTTVQDATTTLNISNNVGLVFNTAARGIVWATPTTFAALGTPANLTVYGCSDCTIANPCAGGGTGAIAKRLNGIWVCN